MFITFEGIDGSGKTTQISLLQKYFEKQGKSVLCLREPGSTSVSEKVRDILLNSKDSIDPIVETLLFCAARAQLVQTVIKPALLEHKIVLCDRYIDSTVVYQGYGRGVSLQRISDCNSFATSDLLPDITFYLDVQVERAQTRAESRQSEKDRMEDSGNEFFSNVREGYLELSRKNTNRIKLIDGSGDIEEIHKKIIGFLP